MAGRLIKLVRDKMKDHTLPRIEFREMSEAGYEMALRRKMLEEAGEWALNPSDMNELADIYEVLRAAAWYFGEHNMQQIAELANAKSEQHGGFWLGQAMYGVRENGTD